jgi:hypothetical protein
VQVLHENKLQAMIKDEFTEADKDGGGTITLVEWRAAAHDQSRLRRYFRSISSLHTLSTSAREVKSAGDRCVALDWCTGEVWGPPAGMLSFTARQADSALLTIGQP